jgi:hypothetical protein
MGCNDLLDHFVGDCEERRGHVEPERPGGLQVDHQLEPGRLLDRNVGGIRAAQNLVGELGRAPVLLPAIGSV